MANPATSADKTAQTNEEIITANAVEVTDEMPTIEVSASGDVIIIPLEQISTSLYCNTSKVFIYPEKTKEGKKSQLAGQQYWIVNYNGKAFTTQDNRFIQALELNDLYEVRLKRNGEYLEFVGFTPASTKRNAMALKNEIDELARESRVSDAMTNKRISWINQLDLKTVTPDESLVQKLLGNAVE